MGNTSLEALQSGEESQSKQRHGGTNTNLRLNASSSQGPGLPPPPPQGSLFVPLNLCFCLPDFSLRCFFLLCPLRTFDCCQVGAGAGHSYFPIVLFLSGRCYFGTLKDSLTIEGEGNDSGVWPDCFKIKMKTFKLKSTVTKACRYILVLCGRGFEKARMLTEF